MSKNVLIVTSTRAVADTQEILRIQDTVSALRDQGWFVDVITSGDSALLKAALGGRARATSVTRLGLGATLPRRASLRRFLCSIPLFLRAAALIAKKEYAVIHGVNDGAIVARLLSAFTAGRRPFVAEILAPLCAAPACANPLRAIGAFLEYRAMRAADAVIIPAFDTLDPCTRPIPAPRISVIPDPRAEIYPETFTFAEYAAAIRHVYEYATRFAGD